MFNINTINVNASQIARINVTDLNAGMKRECKDGMDIKHSGPFSHLYLRERLRAIAFGMLQLVGIRLASAWQIQPSLASESAPQSTGHALHRQRLATAITPKRG